MVPRYKPNPRYEIPVLEERWIYEGGTGSYREVVRTLWRSDPNAPTGGYSHERTVK